MGDGRAMLLGYIRLLKVLLTVGEGCYKKAVSLHLCNLLELKSKNHPIWKSFMHSVELWNEGRGENSLSVLETSTRDSTIRHDVAHMCKRYQMVEVYRNTISELTNEVFDRCRLTDGGSRFKVHVDSPEVKNLQLELVKMRKELNAGKYLIYPQPDKGRMMYGQASTMRQKLIRPSIQKRTFVVNTLPLLENVFAKLLNTINKFPANCRYIFQLKNPLDSAHEEDVQIPNNDNIEIDELLDDVDEMIANQGIANNDQLDEEVNREHANNNFSDNEGSTDDDVASGELHQPNFDDADDDADGHSEKEDVQSNMNTDGSDDDEVGEFIDEVCVKANSIECADSMSITQSVRKVGLSENKQINNRIIAVNNVTRQKDSSSILSSSQTLLRTKQKHNSAQLNNKLHKKKKKK